MSAHILQSLYSRLQKPSRCHIDLCVYASDNDNNYLPYPSSIFTLSSGTFESVLPELRASLAVRASSLAIQAVINEAPWPQDEVQLDGGYSVRIVDTATELPAAADYFPSVAFIRTDLSLVLWGEYEGAILFHWDEVISLIQSRFETLVPNSAPFHGLDVVFNEHFFISLSPLDELPSLITVPERPEPFSLSPAIAATQAYAQGSSCTTMLSATSESPDPGGLQLALHVPNSSSPSSGTSSLGSSPFTDNFADDSLSPTYPPIVFNEAEGLTSDVSQIPFTLGDGGVTTSSFRRHSVGETSAPSRRVISRKAKRRMGGDDEYVPAIDVNDEALDHDTNQHLISDVRASKRMRPITTSAPALLSVPLPVIELARNDTADNAPAIEDNSSSPTSTPAFTSTSTRAPTSSFSSASAPASASTSVPAPRRTRRRGGGTRTKRTQCDYCNKTFSRVQDAQRHVAASCGASPDKTGVECPECGSVLSRLDAAQRHWRGHENPTCEPPEWALRA